VKNYKNKNEEHWGLGWGEYGHIEGTPMLS